MFRKLKTLALKLLCEGLSPGRIALGIAVGITVGVFPIYGTTTIMCLVLVPLLRLNAPIVLAGSFSMSLVKPILILPFLRMGEYVFGADPLPLSLIELSVQFKADAWATLSEFGWSFVHASIGWMVVCPLVFGLVYFAMRSVVAMWDDRQMAG